MNILKLAKNLKEFTLDEISMLAERDAENEVKAMLKDGLIEFKNSFYKYLEPKKVSTFELIEPPKLKIGEKVLFKDAAKSYLTSKKLELISKAVKNLKQQQDEKKNVGVNVGVKHEIIEAIKQNPNITAKELAVALDKTQRTIERHIKDLKEHGKLIRVGSDKTGYWEVT